MKKLISTNLFISILFACMLLMPWNTNFAKSGCNAFSHETFCKNSIMIMPNHISEKSALEIVPGVFPFDDLIIKI